MIHLLDFIHAYRITRAINRFLRNPTRANHQRFTDLLCGRSRIQVERMEREKGLV